MGGSVIASLGTSARASRTKIGEVKPVLYSITYLGLWYQGPALTMDELIGRAKKYGFAGIEIDGKRPHGCPLDWPKSRCAEFRKKVEDQGLVISNVAADNDFSSPISEHREAQLANVRDLIRMTSDLNAKKLRVFLAWPGATKRPHGGGRYDIAQNTWALVHKDFSEEQTWEWCREGLIEASRFAGDHGVVLALQNHGPVIKSYRDVLRMVKEVGSPHLKVCLDGGLLEKKDDVYLRQAVRDVGPLQVHSHYGGEFERKDPSGPILRPSIRGSWGQADYVRTGEYEKGDLNLPFIKALVETGYRGYIGYELCHPLPVMNGKLVGLEFVDRNTELGIEYIKGVIARAMKEVTAQLLGSERRA
jgi:sugar phosphate isomerase/epimerase